MVSLRDLGAYKGKAQGPGFESWAASKRSTLWLWIIGAGTGWGELFAEAMTTAQSTNIIGNELGRCLTLNTAGLTDIKIAEYRQWFKKFNVVALQETHGEKGQEVLLTQRLGFNQGAFSFKSRARAGVGLLWRDNFTRIGDRTWTDQEGRVVCVGLEMEGVKVVFCSVYAPNLTSTIEVQEGYVNFLIQVQLLQDEAMKECGTETLVMMGDLNMILDKDLDSFSTTPKVYQGPKDALMDLVFHQKLTDAFRWANGNKRTVELFKCQP